MNAITYFLMSIVLNAQTGEELSRKVEKGPFDDAQACSVEQQKTGFQRPVVASMDAPTITVYSCVALRGDTQT